MAIVWDKRMFLNAPNPISYGGIWGFLIQGLKKTLVLREIHEEGVKELLAKKDALAACDVAVFVHDR